MPKKRLPRSGKCVYPYPVYEAHFPNGDVVRMSFWSPANKPLDFDHGRAACQTSVPVRIGGAAWRNRKLGGKVTVIGHRLVLAQRRDKPQAGFVEHNGERVPDLHFMNRRAPRLSRPKRTSAKEVKTVLRDLLGYLDGTHDNEAIVARARELAA